MTFSTFTQKNKIIIGFTSFTIVGVVGYYVYTYNKDNKEKQVEKGVLVIPDRAPTAP